MHFYNAISALQTDPSFVCVKYTEMIVNKQEAVS